MLNPIETPETVVVVPVLEPMLFDSASEMLGRPLVILLALLLLWFQPDIGWLVTSPLLPVDSMLPGNEGTTVPAGSDEFWLLLPMFQFSETVKLEPMVFLASDQLSLYSSNCDEAVELLALNDVLNPMEVALVKPGVEVPLLVLLPDDALLLVETPFDTVAPGANVLDAETPSLVDTLLLTLWFSVTPVEVDVVPLLADAGVEVPLLVLLPDDALLLVETPFDTVAPGADVLDVETPLLVDTLLLTLWFSVTPVEVDVVPLLAGADVEVPLLVLLPDDALLLVETPFDTVAPGANVLDAETPLLVDTLPLTLWFSVTPVEEDVVPLPAGADVEVPLLVLLPDDVLLLVETPILCPIGVAMLLYPAVVLALDPVDTVWFGIFVVVPVLLLVPLVVL